MSEDRGKVESDDREKVEVEEPDFQAHKTEVSRFESDPEDEEEPDFEAHKVEDV